jgi:hypothetical protein
MNQIAIMESKIEVLERKLADCERELKAQRLIRLIEKDNMQTNFDQCKEAAYYWKEHAQSLANIAIEQGLISRGKYAEIMKIDRCDVDDTIEKWKKAVNQGGLARKEM